MQFHHHGYVSADPRVQPAAGTGIDRPAELPDEVKSQVDGLDTLYAVHRADGERLALVKDRGMAFVLARQNDLAPVTVH